MNLILPFHPCVGSGGSSSLWASSLHAGSPWQAPRTLYTFLPSRASEVSRLTGCDTLRKIPVSSFPFLHKNMRGASSSHHSLMLVLQVRKLRPSSLTEVSSYANLQSQWVGKADTPLMAHLAEALCRQREGHAGD